MATTQFTPVNIEERQKLGLKAGDTVKVSLKIKEKGKTRLQVFEGLILSVKHGFEPGATFTVRRVSSGVGVEKIFPLYSPVIDKITIVKRAKVRRAKLYHIRKKAAKEIKRQMKHVNFVSEVETPEEIIESAENKEEELQKPEV
ncbi:MAG TPA: 50S ribosomal protein L19 [Candidatus Paceibacterota bacterium]